MSQDTARALPKPKPKRSRLRKVLLWALAVLLLLAVGLTVVYQTMLYAPSVEAKAAMQTDAVVEVSKVEGGYLFEPAGAGMVIKQPSVIFYPGGLVEPESYAQFAHELAKDGHRVYIANMPFNLAFTDENRAAAFIAEHPEDRYVIGGHSLGGVFAARYAAEHRDKLDGVFFLASYADKGGNLAESGLSTLQITASNDGVLNWKTWDESKQYLPSDTKYVTIEGGNHGQFGSYGQQKGDNVPEISADQQLQEVSQALKDWMNE